MKSFLDGVVEDSFFSMMLVREILLGLTVPEYGLPGIYYFVKLRKDVSYIRDSLKNNFSTDDVLKRSHGAGAQYKEVLLYLLIKKFRPKVVVETGVGQGVSSYFILKAIKENGFGRLISIDLPNRERKGRANEDGRIESTYVPKSLEPGWLVPKDLRRNWKLILGNSKSVLPRLSCTPDFFFHDSEHSYETMRFEYEWAFGRMKRGIIASDDIGWSRAWSEFMNEKRENITRVPFPIMGVALLKTPPRATR
jgi:hypothetical protein